MSKEEYDKIREKILAPIQINIVAPIKTHAGYGPYSHMKTRPEDKISFGTKNGSI